MIKPKDDAFEAFYQRFQDTVNTSNPYQPPIGLNDESIKQLYKGLRRVVEVSFHAEMESIMRAVRTCYERVMNELEETVDTENNEENNLQTKVQTFMKDNENFNTFIQHVATYYQSVPEKRMEVVMIRNPAYRNMEKELFMDALFIQQYGFDTAYQKHASIIKAFTDTYHDLLKRGVVLDTETKINNEVIEPTITKHHHHVPMTEG